MRMILLSGGSGTRLWPLSNDYRSKQFIKVMDNENPTTNNQTSMIQRVWANLKENEIADSAIIAASRVQQEVIQAQLGDEVPIVLEPVKRDTFPAICLASSYLHTKMNVSADEVIVVMPVDVDADESFYAAIKQLAIEFETSTANIGLIGLQPTNPSEKFGYILTEPFQEHSTLLKIDRFVEKPSVEEATHLIESGALWNCGVFAFRLSYILGLLEAGDWPQQYDCLLSEYQFMPSISFDYKVVEKEKSIVVKPYKGRWNDLGTWNDWTETMPDPINGKGILSESSINTHIINELQIPVVVMGIPNAVIVASPDGILVADKKRSPGLKDLVKPISRRPMYEETLYGWYRVIDIGNNSMDQQVVTKRVHIWSGKHISYQMHEKREEIWILISGRAEIVINERQFQANAGDVIRIPSGAKHAIKAMNGVDLIEVQIGHTISEEDITRYEYEWQVYEQRRK